VIAEKGEPVGRPVHGPCGKEKVVTRGDGAVGPVGVSLIATRPELPRQELTTLPRRTRDPRVNISAVQRKTYLKKTAELYRETVWEKRTRVRRWGTWGRNLVAYKTQGKLWRESPIEVTTV